MRNPFNFLEGWIRARTREIVFLFSDLAKAWSKQSRKPARPGVTGKQTTVSQRKNRLVQSRPASLEQRYLLLDDQENGSGIGDEIFGRLQQRFFQMANQGLTDRAGQRVIYKEKGRMAPNRPYFYLKPHGATGLLFERSGPGWVVSRAEKIVDRDLFLREGPVLEHANVFLARSDDQSQRPSLPRIKSDQLGNDLLAFSVYEQKLLRHLGLE